MKNSVVARAIAIIGGALLISSGAFSQAKPDCPKVSEAKPWLNPGYAPECRAQYVLEYLKTVDDKLEFIQAGNRPQPGQRNVLEELGLKRGGGSDGPAGVRAGHGSTALPSPLTVSASFDPKIATLFGDLLGQEFFAAGLSSITGPAMDIARTWHFGRTTESFGEDPFLEASVVGPEIRAIQAHHIIATMKHFTAYNEEQGRLGDQPIGVGPAVNEVMSERALREIYLPAFHAAVKVGGVGSVMCSFPQINGAYACQNPYTLNVLKKEWGFEGMVVPDFPDAQRSIVPALLAGLDQGSLTPNPDNGGRPSFIGEKSLKQAIEDGTFPMSRLDDLVLRRLVIPFRIGVFDNPSTRLGPEGLSTPERRAAAATVIEAGSVLLKNDKAALPLGPAVHTVAVIGVQATDKAWVVEQGSPRVEPTHLAPALAAIESRMGSNGRVTFSPGTLGLAPLPVIPASMLKTPEGRPGVRVEYFNNPKGDFSGKPLAVRVEPTLNMEKIPQIPGLAEDLHWSARYTTIFTPDQTGVQKFTVDGTSAAHLWIDGKFMGEFVQSDFEDTVYASVPMTAGKPVTIRLEYEPRDSIGNAKVPMFGVVLGPYITLGWAEPDHLIEDATAAAKKADVAVVFAGHKVGEGNDRLHLGLQNDQDALIEAVAKANPHTIVVLNTGGAVTMPWLNQVAAVLEMWLPGDAGGPAAARLLFGDAEPGGRLPVTFPADETQGPAMKSSEYPGALRADGSIDTAHFDEGIFVGYRYWDQYGQQPLFPFGYGLSYTKFMVKGLAVSPSPDGGATVDVSVKNIGARAGSEVAQVYLSFPKSAGEPPRQLKAFGKIMLEPGGEQVLHLKLDPDAFEYWDQQHHHWTTPSGAYQVSVGTSSREILWSAAITAAAITPAIR
jgi:beta-glucosidase